MKKQQFTTTDIVEVVVFPNEEIPSSVVVTLKDDKGKRVGERKINVRPEDIPTSTTDIQEDISDNVLNRVNR